MRSNRQDTWRHGRSSSLTRCGIRSWSRWIEVVIKIIGELHKIKEERGEGI